MIIADSLLTVMEAEEARRDFKLFVKDAWHVIEPGRLFTNGWHLDAICEHLTAISEGQIKRLLVNMPPRHGKSSLISALWSAWLLLNNPAVRLLCGSYALNLATRDNLKVRRIIKSPWFQQRYGHLFQLIKDQNAKMKFETDQLGYRMVTSVGSGTTGEGGDVLILDDPHNIDEKESDPKRETAIDWFDNTWCSRLNDAQESKMVVVAHRIHEQDVSGHILETNDGEWVHLNLPAEYDHATPCKTYLPSGEQFWQDKRTQEGELLWEDRFPQEAIEKAKKRHGILGYSALFQQNPIPPGGFIFKKDNERLFTISPEGDMYLLITPSGVQSYLIDNCWEMSTSDVAAKDKEVNDFTVFAHWAITPGNDVLLLDVWRGHWSIPLQKEKARLFYRTHLSHRYRAFYWEDVAYQSAISQDLLLEGIPCMEFDVRNRGDKVARAVGASIWQEAGKSYFSKDAHFMEDWRSEIYKFPKARNDDQVDNYSMVCMIVRMGGMVDESAVNAMMEYAGY
jgi:predicted phage terminase large subunit-like protein